MKPTENSDRGDMLASIDRSVFFTSAGLIVLFCVFGGVFIDYGKRCTRWTLRGRKPPSEARRGKKIADNRGQSRTVHGSSDDFSDFF